MFFSHHYHRNYHHYHHNDYCNHHYHQWNFFRPYAQNVVFYVWKKEDQGAQIGGKGLGVNVLFRLMSSLSRLLTITTSLNHLEIPEPFLLQSILLQHISPHLQLDRAGGLTDWHVASCGSRRVFLAASRNWQLPSPPPAVQSSGGESLRNIFEQHWQVLLQIAGDWKSQEDIVNWIKFWMFSWSGDSGGSDDSGDLGESGDFGDSDESGISDDSSDSNEIYHCHGVMVYGGGTWNSRRSGDWLGSGGCNISNTWCWDEVSILRCSVFSGVPHVGIPCLSWAVLSFSSDQCHPQPALNFSNLPH